MWIMWITMLKLCKIKLYGVWITFLFPKKVFSDIYHISGAHGDDHVPFPDVLPQESRHIRQRFTVNRAGNPLRQIGGGDAAGIPLPGGIDFRQNHHIRLLQLPDEVIKQRLGAGIGVGLECQHQTPVG